MTTSETKIIDEGIAALARHYGVSEAEIVEELVGMLESGLCGQAPLEVVVGSLIAALYALHLHGFDDAAVTAAEEAEPSPT
jgi:hypothetical protein